MKKIILALVLFVTALGAAQPGTLDGAFNPLGAGANNNVFATAIQPDGKIIIGGQFLNYDGTGNNRIARMNADGTVDVSFVGKCNALVAAIAVQSDGKIIIGGNFVTVNGVTGVNRITRLNSNGSTDTSFNSGIGANQTVNSISVLSSGKILISGSFTEYNGITRNSIARLNSDGTIDSSFDPGTGADNSIYDFKIQTDGKIIIGGAFTNYNGTTVNRIARLNADGTLDGSFDPGTGANSPVYAVAIQSNGKILLGGDFLSFNSVTNKRITHLSSINQNNCN